MSFIVNRIVCASAVAIVCAIGAFAQDLGAVQARMAQRIPEIQDLMVRQVVGENNQGYLQFIGPQEKVQVVEAENADRKLVYTAIAAKSGQSVEAVGQARARLIAQQSTGGVMVQGPDGQWVKKN